MSRWTLALALLTMFAILGVFLIGEEFAGPPEGPPPEDVSSPRAGGHTVIPPQVGTAEPPPGEAPEENEAPPLLVITNVPGAEVTLRVLVIGGEPDPAPVVRTADPDGSARFAPPADPEAVEEIRAEARATGYVTAKGRLRDGELRLTLTPGAVLRGRIVDGPDSPVPWADLVIVGMPVQRAGPDGTFEVFAPEAGEVAMLVSSRNHLPAEVTVTAPAEDLLIELDRGLTISGRVTFPDGRPAPGVWVMSVPRGALTGEDGRYAISGFVPEDVREEIRFPATGKRKIARAGGTDVDFVMDQHLVRIRVVDEQGRPFKRGLISVLGFRDGEECYTMGGDLGEDAESLIDFYEDTELRISISAPGWAGATTKFSPTGELRFHELRIVMHRPPPPGTIELTAVGGDGRPLPFVILSLADLANPAGSLLAGFVDLRVELDADGRGRVPGVPAGRYRLSVSTATHWFSLEGYGLPDAQEVEVPSGGVVTASSRVLLGGRISVTVRDAEGEVVAPKRVLLFDEKGERIYTAFLYVRPDGAWTTQLDEPAPARLGKPFPPGRYTVRIMRDDEVAGEGEAVIHRGETTELTISLAR